MYDVTTRARGRICCLEYIIVKYQLLVAILVNLILSSLYLPDIPGSKQCSSQVFNIKGLETAITILMRLNEV